MTYNIGRIFLFLSFLPDWIHQCPAGRQTDPIWISASQYAFYQNYSLTQHWTEPCLLPGTHTYTQIIVQNKGTRKIANLSALCLFEAGVRCLPSARHGGESIWRCGAKQGAGCAQDPLQPWLCHQVRHQSGGESEIERKKRREGS